MLAGQKAGMDFPQMRLLNCGGFFCMAGMLRPSTGDRKWNERSTFPRHLRILLVL
jgi:hypothetical protein